MTQFNIGQEVEVRSATHMSTESQMWCKAKIINAMGFASEGHMVQFRDGTRAVFDVDHIRAVKEGTPMTLEQQALFNHGEKSPMAPLPVPMPGDDWDPND